MKNFAVKHPVIFSILLFFAGLVLALVCSLPCAVIGLENGTDIGRILAGVILLLIFRYTVWKNSFFKGNSFHGFCYFGIAFSFGLSCHGNIHAYFGTFTLVKMDALLRSEVMPWVVDSLKKE